MKKIIFSNLYFDQKMQFLKELSKKFSFIKESKMYKSFNLKNFIVISLQNLKRNQ